MTVHFLDTMGGPLTCEIVPLHHTRRTATFADPGDIDGGDTIKDVDLHFLADLVSLDGNTKFADIPLRLAVGLSKGRDSGGAAIALTFAIELGDVTALAAGGKTTGLIKKSQLNRFIAILLFGLQLQDMAGARLYDGYRDDIARRIVDLRHPDLSAE